MIKSFLNVPLDYLDAKIPDRGTDITIIVWACVLIIASVSFIVMLFYAYRYFTKRAIHMNFTLANSYKRKTIYLKKGIRVDLSKLPLPKRFASYQIRLIRTKGHIEGDMKGFIMPDQDVTIVFEPQDSPKSEKASFLPDTVYSTIPLAKKVKEEEDDFKPILLLNVDDLLKHIVNTNQNKDLFPLNNSYIVRDENKDNSYLALKAGDMIYGLVFYNDVTFKVYLRLDGVFAENKKGNIPSLLSCFDDVYSFILDSSFNSFHQFFSLIDYSYSYVVSTNYFKQGDEYLINKKTLEKKNSDILSIDYRLAAEFDPLFDLAQKDAQRYLEHLARLEENEKALDKEETTEKEKVYSKLESLSENQNMTRDRYRVYSFKDNREQDKRLSVSEIGKTQGEIFKELEDIRPITPSLLNMSNLFDYIMARKDMFSLTIDIAPDMTKAPTRFRYQHTVFALLTKGGKAYRLSIRLDENYVRGELVNRHPNIVRLADGDEEDWFKITIDDSYTSYEELYDVLLKSYEYVKRWKNSLKDR